MQVNIITGFVKREIFAKGSKSEHLAVVVDTGVHKFFLRRKGKNPFMDPDLIDLNGKKVEITGYISDNFFYVTNWKILE